MGLLDNLGPMGYVGLGLLQQAGPQRQPVSPWAGMARGLLAGKEAQMQQAELAQKMQEAEQARQLQALQMQKAQQEMEDAKRQRDAQAAFAAANPAMAPLINAGYGEAVAKSMITTDKPGKFQQDYEFAVSQGFKGSPIDFIRAKQPPAPVVNIDNKQDSAYATEIGKYFAGEYKGIQDAAKASQDRASRYGAINQLLEGAYTGAGGESVQSARRLGAMLGMDVSKVGDVDAARALANEAALQLRNPAGGAGMPGAMSDADRVFLANMVPGVGTTPQGRKQLGEVARRIAKRDAEVAALARTYAAAHGGQIDAGFQDLVAQTFAGKDLFADLTAPAQQEPPLNEAERAELARLRAEIRGRK